MGGLVRLVNCQIEQVQVRYLFIYRSGLKQVFFRGVQLRDIQINIDIFYRESKYVFSNYLFKVQFIQIIIIYFFYSI